MAWLILAFDGTDAEAPARRTAARDAHVAFITEEAKAGRLALGMPLHDGQGRSLGSLMILTAEDRSGRDAYLEGEPFAAKGVWQKVACHPFRIAALPYAPWPTPGTAAPGPRSHTIAIAWDGKDPGARDRRLAARPAHIARIRPFAEDGTLLLGGAILDAPDGGMIGSVAVTRHTDDEEARRFWAEDPYLREGVWQEIGFHGSLLRALPYRPLPR
jgi:uncharacterized protein YciI